MDFGSLNMQDIGDILGSMSGKDMEALSQMAQELFSKNKEPAPKKAEPSPDNPFSAIGIEDIGKIMSLAEKLSSGGQSPECKLLSSLKPMLSEKRQDKVDQAIKIMSLLSLLPLLGGTGGEKNE